MPLPSQKTYKTWPQDSNKETVIKGQTEKSKQKTENSANFPAGEEITIYKAVEKPQPPCRKTSLPVQGNPARKLGEQFAQQRNRRWQTNNLAGLEALQGHTPPATQDKSVHATLPGVSTISKAAPQIRAPLSSPSPLISGQDQITKITRNRSMRKRSRRQTSPSSRAVINAPFFMRISLLLRR